MPVKQLKRMPGQPEPPQPKTPQCSANIQKYGEHELKWRMGRYGADVATAYRCIRESVVEIDGKYYCRLHGGHIVLDRYIRGELVDKAVDNTPRNKSAASKPARNDED